MHKQVAGAITGVVMLTGCHSSEQSPQVPDNDISAPVAVDVLPIQLPQAVADQAPNVVAIKLHIRGQMKKDSKGAVVYDVHTSNLSGVSLGNDQYLTAGHGIRNSNNTPIKGVEECMSVDVDRPSKRITTVTYSKQGTLLRLHGNQLSVRKMVGTYIDSESTSVPDIALLAAEKPYGRTVAAPPTRIYGGTPLKIGSPLFLENYQPTADAIMRDPVEFNLTESALHAGLNRPAILGGIVVGYLVNGDIRVVVGTKGYSKPYDSFGRSGMSGGPVYDTRGELVGISNRSTGVMTAKKFGSMFGHKLTGIDQSAKVSEVVIQPIHQNIIASLKRQLQATGRCK